jgi:hypothetical protein
MHDEQHPIALLLKQFTARFEELHARFGSPPDDGHTWTPAAECMREDSPHAETYIAGRLAQFPRYRRRHAASNLFDTLRWPPLALGLGSFWATRRVPDLRPENLAYRLDEHGDIAEWTLIGGRFAALPDDPDAAHPDCTVLEHVDALRRHLMDQLNAHFVQAIAAARHRHPVPEKQLWAAASDGIAGQAAWLIPELKLPLDITAEAEALNNLLPQRARSTIIQIEHRGETERFVDLTYCCFWYLQPDGEKCSTCPGRPMEERIANARGWIDERLAEEQRV